MITISTILSIASLGSNIIDVYLLYRLYYFISKIDY